MNTMSEFLSQTDRLEDRIVNAESKLDLFVKKLGEQVFDRLSELEHGIEQTTPRDPTTLDNRSMHEHLVKLRSGLENDPDAWVSWRITQIESKIEELESELEDL